MGTQSLRHWPVVLLSSLMLAGVATTQYFASMHLLFLPFYLVPCALLTWKIDRRWGTLAATAAAVAGPLIASMKDPGSHKLDVTVWNMIMRLLTLQLFVLFVGQIHRHKNHFERHALPEAKPAKFSEYWAVILASGLLFLIVATLDLVADPHMSFLPLYFLPCMILTLILNLCWGMAAAVVVAISVSVMQYYTGPYHEAAKVFGWNLVMRLVMFLVVTMLLDRIRKENILFSSHNHHHRRPPPARG
jgi:uncharacterized membrane protein